MSRRRSRGFTLVEVLVALLAMSVLASLAWQGLDGILRSREITRASLDATARLATVLTQWEQDLQAVHDTGVVPALAFDGRTLRLTRRSADGVLLVVWAVRGGVWQRWTSPPLTRTAALQQAWLGSFQFLGNEAGQLTVADRAGEWQVYFHRGGAWTNAQSSGDLVRGTIAVVAPEPAAAAASAASAPAVSALPTPPPLALRREVLPAAVRLVIALDGRTLTRDIALGPAS